MRKSHVGQEKQRKFFREKKNCFQAKKEARRGGLLTDWLDEEKDGRRFSERKWMWRGRDKD